MEKVGSNIPAYRLVSFLELVNDFDTHTKIANSQNMGVTIESAFCTILRIEKKELYGILSGYLALIEHIKNQVEATITNSEKYISQLDVVEKALISVGLASDIVEFKKHLTIKTLTTLELCADRLAEVGIDSLSEETLSSIQQQIKELISLLEESTLPKSLRIVLLQKLDEVEAAIKKYKRWGINEFEEVYDSFLGGLYRSRNSIDTKENSSILQKLQLFMNSLLKTTRSSKEIIDTTKELSSSVTELLEQTGVI